MDEDRIRILGFKVQEPELGGVEAGEEEIVVGADGDVFDPRRSWKLIGFADGEGKGVVWLRDDVQRGISAVKEEKREE